MEGRGTYPIHLPNGEIKTIDNVLFVLGLKKNLLLVSQIAKHQFKVEFNSDKCQIKDKSY